MTNDKRIAEIIKGRWMRLSGDYQEVFDRVATYYDMYRCVLNFDESYPWDYKLCEPAVFQLLRTMMSRLNPESYRVTLEARNSKAYEYRERNQQIVNWELSELKKTLLLYRSIFRALIAGRSYVSNGWLYEPAVQIQSDIPGRPITIMRDIVNRAVAKNIRFTDILPANRNIPDLSEQPYILERVTMRYGDMLNQNEYGKKIWKSDVLEKIGKKRMFTDKIEGGYDLPRDAEDIRGIGKEDQFLRNQYVGMIKMSTVDGEEFYTFSEGGFDEILNADTANPYWHGHYCYETFTPFPEDEDFYPMGIVQPLEDLEYALSSSLNQYLTNARKTGNPMWIAGQAASQTPDWQFVNRPDGIVRVAGDVNQVRTVNPADTSNLMTNLRQELATVFEKSSSISSLYSSGVSTTSQLNKTATGAKVIDANIDMNMQMIISLLGAQVLSGIGTQFLELNAQYITEEQEIKITGEKGNQFVKVKPEEITANFDVVANPDTITKTSPVVRQAALLNLKGTIDAEKDVVIDKKPVWKAILNSYPEMAEINDDMILEPDDIANEAIEQLEKGIKPEIRYNYNHKAIRQIIQVYMMSNQDLMEDDTLAMFAEYVDELSKWIDAGKQVATMQAVEDAQNPNPAADPNQLPVNEQQIEQSALESANPVKNMPNNVEMQEAGIL